jgi:hypothetical protein
VKRALLVVTILASLNLAAQKSDSIYHLVYNGTGIINTTKESNAYLLANELRFSIKQPNFTMNSLNSWVYGRQQRETTNNDFSSALDGNIMKASSRLYYWGLLTYDKSVSLNINNRFQAGAGLAYNFIDTDSTFLNLSNGIIYESSNLQLNDSTNNEYNTFRNSLRLRGRYSWRNIFTIETVSFWQPSLQYKHDYIIKSTTNISYRVWKWCSFLTCISYNKLNRLNRENLLITLGLKAEKYF